MYGVMIKIDETLPWIELKQTYLTRKEATRATKGLIRSLQVKVVAIQEKHRPMKVLATVRR